MVPNVPLWNRIHIANSLSRLYRIPILFIYSLRSKYRLFQTVFESSTKHSAVCHEHNTSENTVQRISQENLPTNRHHTQPRGSLYRKNAHYRLRYEFCLFLSTEEHRFLWICGLATRTEARTVIWRKMGSSSLNSGRSIFYFLLTYRSAILNVLWVAAPLRK